MFSFNSFVLFVMIWMVSFFAVLPVGIRPEQAPDEKTGWRGAPREVRMGRVVLITSILAGLIWTGAELAITHDWLSFRHGFLAGDTAQ